MDSTVVPVGGVNPHLKVVSPRALEHLADVTTSNRCDGVEYGLGVDPVAREFRTIDDDP